MELFLNNFKTFADDKMCFTQMLISVCIRVETIVGKGEKDGNQWFFQKVILQGLLQVRIV